MTLASLRPTEPTDWPRLSALLRKQNAKKAALPAELPEQILISVARDLRSLEDSDEDDPDEASTLAAPMALVLSLLLGSQDNQPISLSQPAIYDSLKSYQWAVEREIVTRLTGVGGRDDMEILLRRLAQINAGDSSGDSRPA